MMMMMEMMMTKESSLCSSSSNMLCRCSPVLFYPTSSRLVALFFEMDAEKSRRFS